MFRSVPLTPPQWMSPLVRPFFVSRLADDFPAAIETPEWDHIGLFETPEVSWAYWQQWAIPWEGEGRTMHDWQAAATRNTYPTQHVERIRWFDSPGPCVVVEPPGISENGIAIELARAWVSNVALGVVETIATWWQADAIDANGGGVLFSFSSFPPGVDPCDVVLVHPNPAVTPNLVLRWRLVADQNHGGREHPLLPLGVTLPIGVVPNAGLVVPDWSDGRYSNESVYSRFAKPLVSGPCWLRLFALAAAPDEVWRIRLQGRLQGYWQSAGERGAALAHAFDRW